MSAPTDKSSTTNIGGADTPRRFQRWGRTTAFEPMPLTYAVDAGNPLPREAAWGKPAAAPVAAPPPDRCPMYTALIGLGARVLIVGGAAGLMKDHRRDAPVVP